MAGIDDATVQAVILVAVTGAVTGLLGGMLASTRSSLVGSTLLGAIGGIAGAAILRIAGAQPVFDAGVGFSYLYAAIGGLLLGYVVAASNR